MGEKIYKPIIPDGKHLVHSKDNPARARGLAQDENNKNTDIIEWEEYDIDDLINDNYNLYPYDEPDVQLTPEQEKLAQSVGELVGAVIVTGVVLLFDRVISPWWRNTAWPWIKSKSHSIKKTVSQKAITTKKVTVKNKIKHDKGVTEVQLLTDKEKELMNKEEAIYHIEQLRYHTYAEEYHKRRKEDEFQLLSNARIEEDCELQEPSIEQKEEYKNLELNLTTSMKLPLLTDSEDCFNNDECIPVQIINCDNPNICVIK